MTTASIFENKIEETSWDAKIKGQSIEEERWDYKGSSAKETYDSKGIKKKKVITKKKGREEIIQDQTQEDFSKLKDIAVQTE